MTAGPGDRLIRRSSEVAFVESARRVALVNLRAPAAPPMLLLDTAADIWGQVVGEVRLEDVVAGVAEVYGISPDAIDTDVRTFVMDLVAQGILVEDEGGHPAGRLDE